MKVSFLGLGVMGFPMAGHLADAHDVSVYNRTPAKAREWQAQFDGSAATTVGEAVRSADFVMACVGNDNDAREVTTAAFAAMPKGAVYIDHTTISAELARELAAKAGEFGLTYLDAPVSGGQAGAKAGTLSIMAGGDQAAFDRAEPVMRAYGRAIMRMGDSGAGALAKMVNQICIAGVVQSLSEGLAFARHAGVDGAKLLEVITKGAAGSWQMENRGHTMLKDEFDFGFAVDWMIKDLGLCVDESRRNGAKLPIAGQVLEFYRELSASGGGRLDTSSLIRRL